MANNKMYSVFERFWYHVVAKTGSILTQAKTYTDSKVGGIIDGTTVVPEATHSSTADKAVNDGAGNNIVDTYETKSNALANYDSLKGYADNAATNVKNDLLNGAGDAYDTLKELGDLIDDNTDAIEALRDVAAGKANATHNHAIADVTGLQTALDEKAEASHGIHVTYSTTAPIMDGVASTGSATTVSRSDHRHPVDTSRASQESLDAHTGNTTAHLTSTERSNWNAGYTHSQVAHAPSNAEKNQNAFSNVVVGSVTVAADTTMDTLTLVAGDNVSITPDATNDKITINATDTIYSHPNSGVAAGTYKSVTVNAQGHITSGTNPTTLAGYGITDAALKDHTHPVDDALSSTSTNPVQNKVINSALITATNSIVTNTSSINAHTDRISALETKVGDGFEPMTSEEILAMFE